MYAILCKHYHPEDIEFPEQSEPIPHFISYNAGTRVLNTYPEARAIEINVRERVRGVRVGVRV